MDLAHVNDLAVDRNGNAVAACRAYSDDGDLALMTSWTASGESRWADIYTPPTGLSAQATAVAVNRAGTAWFAGKETTAACC